MSRFHVATLLTIAAAAATTLLTDDSVRRTLLALIGVAYVTLFGLGVVFIRLQFFGPAMCRGPVGGKQCALTFDDGPDPSSTPPLLTLLQKERVPATFFCVGVKVTANPRTQRGHSAFRVFSAGARGGEERIPDPAGWP